MLEGAGAQAAARMLALNPAMPPGGGKRVWCIGLGWVLIRGVGAGLVWTRPLGRRKDYKGLTLLPYLECALKILIHIAVDGILATKNKKFPS